MGIDKISQFNENQREAFDNVSDRFLSDLPTDVCERMKAIVSAAEIAEGEDVLDVGAGTGALIPDIRKFKPGRVYACDLSGKMLEHLQGRYPGVECYQCDIRDLSLDDASVDVVFMNGMYGNIADKPGAMRNILRMLRPGGRVVISHPEGRAYVEGLVRSEPFPITPLPSGDEASGFFASFGLAVRQYTDEPRLLIIVGVLT